MKILSAEQIRALDAYTIEHEPISSLDLMERAASVFTDWLTDRFPTALGKVAIFCGPGNNGGDGLVVARLLYQRFYEVSLYLCEIGTSRSADYTANLKRLPPRSNIAVYRIQAEDPLPELDQQHGLIIDAIFGSGLSRPLKGYWASLIEHLNEQHLLRIAIDVPSGLFCDQPSTGVTLQANHSLSFELPKLAFFFPENYRAVGAWATRSIGLNTDFIEQAESPYHYVDRSFAQQLLRPRHKYDHKGTFGHALLVAGSYGKVGAAILATRAALRSGTGLVTLHAPKCAYAILQNSIPEAMVSIDRHEYLISQIPEDLSRYRAIGVGCGMDTHTESKSALESLIHESEVPLVLDADALNIIAQQPELLEQLPTGSILTPHPKEFSRLFGDCANDFERNQLQREKAQRLNIYLLLKGAHSCIATPDGQCYFNSTGNPGMATGGSGDVLTGMITGLLAQGYSPKAAVILGVYLHGLAGDLAVETQLSQEALIASDLIDHLGAAFRFLKT